MRRDQLPVATDPVLAELLAGQREILAEIRALNARLAARDLRSQIAFANDPDRDLLLAINAAIGDAPFVCAALLLERDEELRAALTGLDAEGLGRRLGRLEGRVIDGWRVVRLDRQAAGNAWSVERCTGLQPDL